MQKPPAASTPLNAYRNTLTAPSSFFTLEPVSISPADKAKKQAPKADVVADQSTGPATQSTMTTRHLYDCFDTHKKGHFHSVDELFDRGVWIGYFAEESRSTRYRQLPSFRELEANHKNLNLPFPTPLPNSPCSNREAVCRGCFSDNSSVLQLKEIRFGARNRVIVMPLEGADDAGLFCIMLPQPLDRSIKALESFRPYEHNVEHDGNKLFTNDFMLLAIRDRENSSGVLNTIRNTLDPAELARIASCRNEQRPNSWPNDHTGSKPVAEKTPQSGGRPMFKRKQQQQPTGDNSGSAKRKRTVILKGPRMMEHTVSLSDDDMDDSPLLPNARSSMSRARVQQEIPVSPSNVPNPSPTQTPRPPVVNMNELPFTNEQARRIHFVWKFDFEGTKYVQRCTLSDTRTFRGVLDSFRADGLDAIPSASRQLKAKFWMVRYILADGSSQATLVSLSSVTGELNFDGLMRSLAEKEEWKKTPGVIVELEVRAMMSGVSD